DPLSVAPQRIRFGDTVKKIRFTAARESSKRSLTNFVALFVKLTGLQMFAHERNHLLTHVVTIDRVYVDTAEKTLRRRHAGFFMSTRTQSAVDKLGCRRFAKIVCEGREHHRHLPRIR